MKHLEYGLYISVNVGGKYEVELNSVIVREYERARGHGYATAWTPSDNSANAWTHMIIIIPVNYHLQIVVENPPTTYFVNLVLNTQAPIQSRKAIPVRKPACSEVSCRTGSLYRRIELNVCGQHLGSIYWLTHGIGPIVYDQYWTLRQSRNAGLSIDGRRKVQTGH
jgi:hypothetical protein